MDKYLSRITIFALWFYVSSYPVSIYFKTIVPFMIITIFLGVVLTIGTIISINRKETI